MLITPTYRFHSHPLIDSMMVCSPIPVPLLDHHPLMFLIERTCAKNIHGDFILAINHFLNTSHDVHKIMSQVYEHYQNFHQCSRFICDTPLFQTPEQVWKSIDWLDVGVIRQMNEPHQTYIQVSGLCQWETEHPIQLFFHEGHTFTRALVCDGVTEQKPCKGSCGMYVCYNG